MKIDTKYLKSQITIWNMGLILIAVVAVNMLINGAKNVKLNSRLEEEISKIATENEVLQLEIENQKAKSGFYDSDYFKDMQVRRLLGKAAPGETIYTVPKETAIPKVKTQWPYPNN
jgi:cell division protein FtsB